MFYILALMFFLISAYSVVGLIRSIGKAVRSRDGIRSVVGWLGASTFLCASMIYMTAYMLYSGGFASEKACAHDGIYDERLVGYRSFPLSTRCTRGGDVIEIVPFWINPTVTALLIIALVCTATLLLRRRSAD